MKRLSKEQKEEIYKLYEMRPGYKRIAKHLGLHRNVVRYWILKVKPNPKPKPMTEKQKKAISQRKEFELLLKRGYKSCEIASKLGLHRAKAKRLKLKIFGNKNYKSEKAKELYLKNVSISDIAVYLRITRTYALTLTKELRDANSKAKEGLL